jgi:lysophospholipase L1-like esterase
MKSETAARKLNNRTGAMAKHRSHKWHALFRFNFIIAVGLAALFVLVQTYTHTLSRNGNWVSSKTSLAKGVMGAWSFMLTYRALANNHLDLGTWHGYQEIFLNKSVPFRIVELDFQLDTNACLVIFYEKNHDTLTGVRISANPDYTHSLLRTANARFIQKYDIKLPDLKSGWNRIKLEMNDNGTILTLNQDLTKRVRLPAVDHDAILGFRNYEASAILDNIHLSDSGGQVLFTEKFHWKPSFLIWILLLFLIGNLAFIAIPVLRKTLVIASVNLTMVICILLCFFLFWGRYLYPREWMINWKSITTTIQSKDEVMDMNASEIPGNAPYGMKVIFLGSSQTWGAGATSVEATFISRLEKMLNDSTEHPVQCFNAAVSGINSDEITKTYSNYWISKIKPDICIINLALNDAGNSAFRNNLEEIIIINRRKGILTILIPEPVERHMVSVSANHQTMKILAEKYGLMAVDIQGYLNDHFDSGFIFWDCVHLTDFGQELFADKLHQELKEPVKTILIKNQNER